MQRDVAGDVSWMERTLIYPSTALADGRDVLWAAGSVVLLLAEIALPAVALYALLVRAGDGAYAFHVVFYYCAAVAYVAFASRVRWLKVNRVGLTFGRTLGGPRVLRWEEITSVRPAARRDVIVHGWLWPPLIPREATRSMSSAGQFRIEYRGGYCFFPPASVPEFLGALEYWRARSHADYPPGVRELSA